MSEPSLQRSSLGGHSHGPQTLRPPGRPEGSLRSGPARRAVPGPVTVLSVQTPDHWHSVAQSHESDSAWAEPPPRWARRCHGGPRDLKVAGLSTAKAGTRTRHRMRLRLSRTRTQSRPGLTRRLVPSDSDWDRELPPTQPQLPVPENWPVFLPGGGATAINLKAPVTGGCHGGWEPCSVPLPWYSRPSSDAQRVGPSLV